MKRDRRRSIFHLRGCPNISCCESVLQTARQNIAVLCLYGKRGVIFLLDALSQFYQPTVKMSQSGICYLVYSSPYGLNGADV